MTSRGWTSRALVVAGFVLVAVPFAWIVAHPDRFPTHQGRVFFIALFGAPAIVLGWIAVVFMRGRHGARTDPPLEIPQRWETAIRIAVWAALAVAYGVLALKIISP